MQGEHEVQPNGTKPNENVAEGVRLVVRKPRVTSSHPLPSERYAYSIHAAALRKLNTMTSGGKLAVSAATVYGDNVPKQATELNVRFWQEAGLVVQEEGKWKPTPAAVQYLIARAASPERAQPYLNSIISPTWFADAARMALATKHPIPREEMEKDLAVVAGTPYDKRAASMRVLVDYLLEAGVLRDTPTGLEPGDKDVAVIEPNPNPPAASELLPPPTVRTTPKMGAEVNLARPRTTPSNWWTRSGPGFILQVEPNVQALRSLRRNLDLLDTEVAELTAAEAPPTS